MEGLSQPQPATRDPLQPQLKIEFFSRGRTSSPWYSISPTGGVIEFSMRALGMAYVKGRQVMSQSGLQL